MNFARVILDFELTNSRHAKKFILVENVASISLVDWVAIVVLLPVQTVQKRFYSMLDVCQFLDLFTFSEIPKLGHLLH